MMGSAKPVRISARFACLIFLAISAWASIASTTEPSLGMKLLPTGRRNSLAIFMYPSVVGLGSFLLSYLPGLLCTLLTEIGISEDMYNPICIKFWVVFIVMALAFVIKRWVGMQ